MPALLSIAVLTLSAAPTGAGQSAPACSVASIPTAEQARLLEQYRTLKRTQGNAAADRWIRAEGLALYRRMAAEGRCSEEANAAESASAPSGAEAPLLNRDGQPCRRIEMENQNVPNIGGSMGWALVQVCKD